MCYKPALFAISVSNTKMPIENFLLRTERLIILMFLLDESHLLSFGLSVIGGIHHILTLTLHFQSFKEVQLIEMIDANHYFPECH